jgi:hypothetical protein
MAEKASYKPLLSSPLSEQDDAEPYEPPNGRQSPWRQWLPYVIILNTVVSWGLVIGLSIIIINSRMTGADRFRQHKLYPAQLTYSPAQDEIEYEVKVFHKGIEDAPSEFQGPPSAQLDNAWEDLYTC